MSVEAKTKNDVREAVVFSSPMPRVIRTLEETGLPFFFLVELLVKTLFVRGQTRLTELSAFLKLPASVIEPIITFMRGEKLCEVMRHGLSGTDADLVYSLTDAGRMRATEYLRHDAYTGPAPVTLHQYCAQVEAQSVVQMRVLTEDVAAQFASVVVSTAVLRQLGAAMNSGRAIFIHGPAGSGKTYLAERLAGLLKGDIWIPYAVLIDGEVVQVYDPEIHSFAKQSAGAVSGIDNRMLPDLRWVNCTRPTVLTGGELSMAMLELQFDPGTRFYHAPPHLKANNGLFIVDDLGRQRCSPAELMNRWIVPLDRRRDYLSLHTGHKFMVPFDVVIVFSSNFPPEQLADESFLRRLGYKIHVGAQTEQAYETLFRQECERQGVAWSDDAFRYLLHKLHYPENRPLLACYPRDLITQVKDLAQYEDTTPILDERVLDWAWNNYFVGERC